MIKKIFSVCVLFLLVFSFPLLSSAEQLTILHANDTHSHLYSFGPFNTYGGIARMSTLIKRLKKKNKNVLTLHAGDVFVGTFAFNKYLAYPELKIMEGLYDAMCLGNHEFDLGADTLTAILGGAVSSEEPVMLPILCANVDLSGYPNLAGIVKPWIIKEVGDIKVGLIGVVTTDENNYSQEVHAILTDPYQAAGQAANILGSQGCDIVICLSHLGKLPDELGLSQVPGIDVIVGGHSHDAVFEPINEGGKIIVQAGEFGKYLGELKVNIDTEGNVSLTDYKLHSVDWRIRRDFSLIWNLMKFRTGIYKDPRFGPVYSKTIARAKWDLEEKWEEGNPSKDTPLGNLVTDALRRGVKKSGIELPGGYPKIIALEANGYIAHRIYRGRVVGNDILRSVPYGYDPESGLGFKINAVLLAGQQILAGLEFSVSNVEYTDELSMQASGLRFEYDSSKPPASLGELSRVDPASVKIHGELINPNGLYWVVLNEQLATLLVSLGLQPFSEVKTGLFEYNLVRDFMSKLKVLSYTSEGRIVDTAVK